MTQTQQTILALAIYTIWITLLYIRIFDKTLKNEKGKYSNEGKKVL